MRFKAWLAPLVLPALSLLAALFGAAWPYREGFAPGNAGEAFREIRPDRWIADGAEMRFADLAPRGNRLRLQFDGWHPPGREPAKFEVSVCGRPAAAFTAEPGSAQVVSLRGGCRPRVVAFRVLNPFRASKEDRRALGAKLLLARVTSPLGVPLLDPLLVLRIAAGIFVLALAVYWTFGRIGFGVPVLAGVLAAGAGGLRLEQPTYLWLFCLAVALGMWLGARAGSRAVPAERPAVPPPGMLLMIVIAVGAALRFYGLDFGLPNPYHPDEMQKHAVIMRMAAKGTLNPEYFKHPSLLLYGTYLMNHLLHWCGWSGGWGDSLILAGRTVSALAGTLSIWLVYLIGRGLFSGWAGVMAAAVLAFSPLHITCSRYLKEDALLTAAALAVVAAVLKAVREDRRGWLYAAGLLAGFCASVKYTGVLAAAAVAAAPWLKSGAWKPDRAWLWSTGGALAIMPAGFLIGTPYSVLEPAVFWKDFSYERAHMSKGHATSVDAWSQYWMYHFRRSLLPGLHPAAALLGAAGLGVLLWRRRMQDLYVAALVLLFYLPAEWVKAKPAPQPERYILPCLPFVALAAGEALRVVWAARLKAAAVLLAAAALALPLKRSLELAAELKPDTRALMGAWVRANLPRGSVICIDWKWYAPEFAPEEFRVIYPKQDRVVAALDRKALKAAGCRYLMVSSLYYDRFLKQPGAPAVLREQLKRVFRSHKLLQRISAASGSYGFHNPTLSLFEVGGREDEPGDG